MDLRIMTIPQVAEENEISEEEVMETINDAKDEGSLVFSFQGDYESVTNQFFEKIDELKGKIRVYSYFTTVDLIDMGDGTYIFTCDQFEQL